MIIKKIYKSLISEKKRNKVRLYFAQLICPLYFGTKFTCNCCNKSFRKFLPKGNTKRENAQCPCCGSLERTRLLKLYLENETEILTKKGIKILHFAPEMPLFRMLKKLDAEYIDGDINPIYARNIVDITNIHFPDNYFDFIICSHVLGHVPDEAKAIKELYRTIKPNGEVLILTLLNLHSGKTYENEAITTPQDKLVAYGEPDLCRLHGWDIEEKLKQSGFKVLRIDYRKNFSPELNEKHRLGDGQREIIFKCAK